MELHFIVRIFFLSSYRSLTPRCLNKTGNALLALCAIAAFAPLAVQAKPLGINFQTEGRFGFPAGNPISAQAFGVAAANWSNLTPGPGGAQIVSAPGGGSLAISWSSAGTWGVNMGLPAGENDAYWGYLDDSGTGFAVTISGLSGAFSNYVVQAVASTDQGNAFQPVTILPGAQTLTFSAAIAGSPNRLAGVSSVSTPLTDNAIQLRGLPKAGFNRGTLAGIIITDVPVIERQPQAPTNTVHQGESFSLSVGAIGPNLTYQWRRNGSNIAGENSATCTRLNATTNDSGRYDVIVANALDRVVSSNVTVTVQSGPPPGVAPVVFSAKPATFQLYPRNRQSNKASVAIKGTVVAPAYDSIIVEVDREGVSYLTMTKPLSYANGVAAFSIAVPIPAELANYNFKIYLQSGLSKTLVASADKVVAGDALLINGQSNAQSVSFYGSANQNQNPFVRSFGSRTEDQVTTLNDLNWYPAEGDAYSGPGAIGQWGLRLGRLIVDSCRVPVAILNQANGGSPIPYFQRNDGNPEDLSTDYGRALYRLRQAGLANALRAILWYQGEAEFDNADAHETGFRSLHADWLEDYPSVEKIYVHQVHTGCGVTRTDLQNRQRRFADSLDRVEVMSTTGIDAHDGCHYAYLNGYELVAWHIFKMVERDLYGALPQINVDPPNVRCAYFSTAARDEITLVMRNPSDPLVWEPGAEADFLVNDVPDAVLSGSVSSNRVVLKLSAPATDRATITYKGHPGIYPGADTSRWVKNGDGVGLLCFYREPVLAAAPPMPGRAGAIATQPAPAQGATNISVLPELTWIPAANMISQAVYFGTNSAGTFRRNTTGSIFWPGALAPGATYYWRVDTTTTSGVITGQVWSFTTLVPPAVAIYGFEGNVDDQSGNGNHGAATAVTYVTGKVGLQAALFDGAGSYVLIPRSIGGSFSVALWIRTTDTGGTGSQWWSGKGLVDGEVSGTADDWGAALLGSRFVLGIGNPDTTISSATAINDGDWHHLVATRDSTGGQIRLYVDGVLDASGAGPTGSKAAAPNLRIGSIQTGGGFLNGIIDEVRLYERVLSEAEILALANRDPSTVFSGRATALSASVPGATNSSSDTGPLSPAGGSRDASLYVLNEPGLFNGEIAHASTIGQADRTRSEASVANFALTLGGVTISAEFLMTRATAVWQTNGTLLSGDSEIDGLVINGQPVVVNGTPNQTILLPNGRVTINEQTSASNQITVQGLHVVIDGAADVAVALAQAGITRVTPPLCEGEDAVSGAGWMVGTPVGTKGNFSLKAGIKAGVLSGHLHYKDDATGMTVKATSISSYQSGGAIHSRHFEGAAEIDGEGGFSYAVDVADQDEAGGEDSFSIRLSNGYQAGGSLRGGNVQLHSPCE